jgi:hypothetical protein
MPLLLRHADGGWREVEVVPTTSEALAVHGIVGMVVRDRKDRPHTLDALRHRLAFEDLLTRVASSFILRTPDEIDEGIHDVADIGRFVDVDRAYVYVVDDDHEAIENTHSWNAITMESDLERPYRVAKADAPKWMEELDARSPRAHLHPARRRPRRGLGT